MNDDFSIFQWFVLCCRLCSYVESFSYLACIIFLYSLIVKMVTHNMQQAARISDMCAFFLLGDLVEYGDTQTLFSHPVDKRTDDYITGRFG